MPLKINAPSEDEYSPSDSDEDYTENEKILLEKVRNKKAAYSDSEEEVLAVRSADEDDDSDDQSDIAVSDIEGQEDDDLPDIRAWGKDKRNYYKTDYVDPDYGGFQGKDAQLAEFEEEEARTLQKQLAEQLDDADFALDLFPKKTVEEEKVTEEIVKTDISKLSKKQKLQILEKESPEFFSLVEDFRNKMTLAKDYLCPVLEKFKAGELEKDKAVEFVQTQYGIILNYCMNIYMYLYLKSTKTNVQNHPVIKRLFQYRQLLLKLEPVFEEIVKPQIEWLLAKDISEENPEGVEEKKQTVLNLLAKLNKKPEMKSVNKKPKKKKQISISEDDKPAKKKVKFADEIVLDNKKNKKTKEDSENESSGTEDESLVVEEENEEANVVGREENEESEEKQEKSKRAITYEMAKNKGLTPHRKKEQRNPRVKHRMKYRKAVIRRKGAVREPRKELKRYGGEISGIKATVSRSIKIK